MGNVRGISIKKREKAGECVRIQMANALLLKYGLRDESVESGWNFDKSQKEEHGIVDEQLIPIEVKWELIPHCWELIMKRALIVSLAVLLAGCSTYRAPHPAETEPPCWPDVPVVVHGQNSDGLIEYRTCRDARTRAGVPSKLEYWLERVAQKFCARQGGHYKLLRERSAFQDMDDTARVELIFVCTHVESEATIVTRGGAKKSQKMKRERYRLLKDIQELYNMGAISKEEFEEEKRRILGK